MPNLSSHIQTFSYVDNPYAGNDFILEALSGFLTQTQNGGDITWDGYKWVINTHQTLNGGANIQKIDELAIYPYTWAKRHQVRTRVESTIANDPLGDYFLWHGNPDGPFNGFGLIFTPTKIIGRTGDLTSTTDLDLIIGLEPGTPYQHKYEMIFYPGNGVYFYIDEVFVNKIVDTLPYDDFDAYFVFKIQCFNGTDTMGGSIALSRLQISQDI